MEDKLTDRAQAYWETIPGGKIIDAEQLFDTSRRPKDLGEDIRHVRSFLTRKFNDGMAFLIPGHSPPTYKKLELKPSVVEFCTMVFNQLPDGEKMTTFSFNNHLPLKLQDRKKVGNFFHRAKICGSLFNVLDESGLRKMVKETKGTFLQVEKKGMILALPNMGKIPINQSFSQTHKSEESPKNIQPPEDMATKIFDMKASDVGMSIFELLHKLMKENEAQGNSIKTLKESLNGAMSQNTKLVDSHNHLAKEVKDANDKLEEYQKKDLTYGDIYKKDPIDS